MATSLTLRSVKGSALSHAEMDTNLTNLAATADAALPASAATPVTDFKDTPTEFDETTIFDNAAGGAMKRVFLGDMPAAGGGYSTASQVRNALESLTDTNRLDASAVKNLPDPTAAVVRDALASLSGTDRLDASAIKNLPSGGSGSAADPMNLWDYWYFSRFGNNNVAANDMFLGAAVSSGTNNTAIPTGGMAGYNTQGVFLRSSTTGDGGYKYQTSSLVADYFGTISHKFRGQFLWRTAFTNVTVRLGFHDTETVTDATDGAYFEIVGDTCSAKTANNSTRTTHATTATLSLDVAYTFDIDVNAAGTEARFRVYAGNSPTPILDVTNTTNIPTTSARTFGAGIVATESTTTESDIGILYGLGVGTVEGFARVHGVLELVPSAFVDGDWTATAGDTEVDLDITALPSAGSGVLTELQYRRDGGTATALTGLGTGVRTITGLTNNTEYDFEIRAVNEFGPGLWSDVKSRTPVASGSAPTIVQIAAPAPVYDQDHVMTFGVATTATRTIVVKVAAATSSGVPTVTGSDAVSFGSEIFSYAYDGQTYRFFRLANAASLTSVTANFSAGATGADVVAYEVAGLGAAPVLDGTPFEANYTSNATLWEYDVAPSVAGTVFFGHAAFTNATTVASSNAPMVADEHAPTDNYAVHCHAELSASGAQTLSYVIADERQGGRAGIVLRPGS